MSNDTQAQAHMALVNEYAEACNKAVELGSVKIAEAAYRAVEASARQLSEQGAPPTDEVRGLIASMVSELRSHRYCGDCYPDNGWPGVMKVLADYAAFKRNNAPASPTAPTEASEPRDDRSIQRAEVVSAPGSAITVTKLHLTQAGSDSLTANSDGIKDWGPGPHEHHWSKSVTDEQWETAVRSLPLERVADDPLLGEALRLCVEKGYTSVSFVQRRLNIGYQRAGELVATINKRGLFDAARASKGTP